MERLKQYDVAFKGLQSGSYEFDFEFDDTLFTAFESDTQGVFGGHGSARVQLTRRPDSLLFLFEVHAQVRVECDVCLDAFEMPSHFEAQLSVRFGPEPDDQQDEIIYLGPNDDYLNLAPFIYEYVVYGLPIQRVHPKDARGHSGCDPHMLQRLGEHLVEDQHPAEDPRWAELRKLKGDQEN